MQLYRVGLRGRIACFWMKIRRDSSELSFWLTSIDHYNGQAIWRSQSALTVVYSDASDTGFGGYLVEHGNHVAHGQWMELEAKQSSGQ